MFAHSKTTTAVVISILSMWAFLVGTLWAIWTFDVTAVKVAVTSVILFALSATYMATTEDDMV